MPTYQYACTVCDHELEAVQSFSDDPLTVCPECAGRLRKVFSAVGVVFKGSGFYRNDSRAGNGKNGASTTSSNGKSESATSQSDSSGTSSNGSSGSSSGSSGSSSGGSSSGGSSSGGSSGAKSSSKGTAAAAS